MTPRTLSSASALVVVATPIGNLGDLSPRAAEALRDADVIACEDTRHTRKLLTASGITGARLLALHDHNEATRAGEVLGLLDRGLRVVLVSDAGTPGISDPGERVVATVAAAGHRVEIVPGPSALVAALVLSGLPTGRFCFEGFLPRKGPERRARLAAIAEDQRTTVVYEAPHRVRGTIADLARTCGALRRVAIARELTKLHEDVWRGSLERAAAHVEEHEPRGEHVIVVGGAPPPAEPDDVAVAAAMRARLDAGQRAREAADAVAADLGVSRRRAYEAGVGLKAEPDG